MRHVTRWLRALFLHRRLEQEMQEEMRQHVESATERMMARGLSRDEARRAALREFGNEHYLQEEARDARGARWVEALTPDAKLALRMLAKNWRLTVVGGLGMAVAITIAIGFFTFMRFYYSDAPVEEGDRVVTVEYVRGDFNHSTLFDYQIWKDELESIQSLAAYRSVGTRQLEGSIAAAGPIEVAEMTGSGFRVARVPPLLGRWLLESDEVEGAAPVAVIGYREWNERLGADPTVVGREVRLDGIPHTVVGVMPDGFRLPVNHGFWVPMATGTPVTSPEGGALIHVFGRLASGVDAAAAEAEAGAIGDRMIVEYPQVYDGLTAVVRPYIRHVFDVQAYPAWSIWLMQVFAALILVAVSVNVAVLFYARTALRSPEITVRMALGASRSRIVMQLFLEALALTALAALIGALIAHISYRQFMSLADIRERFPYWLIGGLPPATTLYAAGLAAFAALVVGVLPALQATGGRLQSTLREMGGGTGMRMGRNWTLLICAQVAAAVGVLPAVVGIAWNYTPPRTPAFPASELVTFRLPPQSFLAGPAEYGSLQAELFGRVESIPGVVGAAFSSFASDVRIATESPTGVIESSRAGSQGVDVHYFDVRGVPLVAGRTFTRDDAVGGANAVIVNRAFVDEFFAGGSALGQRFREAAAAPAEDDAESVEWFVVVGVVENMFRPSEGPVTYHPIELGAAPLVFSARARGNGAATIVPRVREIAAEVAPGAAVEAKVLSASYEEDPNALRLLLLMVGLSTFSVLLLSAAGVSAMMSFAVTQRRREIGIRTALGAPRGRVFASIFSRSARQLGLGLLIGAAGAGLVDRLAGGELLRGEATPIIAFVATIMLCAGLLATVGPARRALRIQPMEALREE